MRFNEVGDLVPQEVAEAAQRRGCLGGVRYVYKVGKYSRGGKGFPAASIGGAKASRFRSYSFEQYKVSLGSGWVAFKSPSASNPRQG